MPNPKVPGQNLLTFINISSISSSVRSLVSGMNKMVQTRTTTWQPPKMNPTLGPRLTCSGLMRYGIPHTISRSQSHPAMVASATVLERSLVDGSSPRSTCDTAPHVAPYEKMNRHTKAERHLAATTLEGAAVPTAATIIMHVPWPIAPPIRMGLRPMYLIRKNDVADPAMPHTPDMTDITNGLVTPDMLKKKVP